MALLEDPENEVLKQRFEEMDTLTTEEYVLKAMQYLMRYEELRRSTTRPVEDFRSQRSRNPALSSNKRRQRDFEKHNTSMTQFVSVESGRRLRAVYDEYMEQVEGSKTSTSQGSQGDHCSACSMPMVINTRENVLVCPICGTTREDTTGITFGVPNINGVQADSTTFCTRFPYLRVNHFNEALQQIQGKESNTVPQEVVDLVSSELQRMRTPRDRIRPLLVRDILKRHRKSQYYENSPQICRRIGGRSPPDFPAEMEERCRLMFWACQEPFERHRPSRRTNWISYNYTLMKVCELLGASQEVLDDFPIIKSREKLFEHDRLWKLICKDLGWPFHRTI